jgi:hypothetical protein
VFACVHALCVACSLPHTIMPNVSYPLHAAPLSHPLSLYHPPAASVRVRLLPARSSMTRTTTRCMANGTT